MKASLLDIVTRVNKINNETLVEVWWRNKLWRGEVENEYDEPNLCFPKSQWNYKTFKEKSWK